MASWSARPFLVAAASKKFRDVIRMSGVGIARVERHGALRQVMGLVETSVRMLGPAQHGGAA
jgi:hypothetical protein